MKIKTLTFLIFSIFMSYSIAQEVKDISMPGKWEYSINIKENEKTVANSKVTKCLSKEYIEKNPTYNIEQIWDSKKLTCKVEDLKKKGNTTSFNAICLPATYNKVKEVHIEADYTSQKDKSLIAAQYTTHFTDNSKKIINTTIEGTRVGECN